MLVRMSLDIVPWSSRSFRTSTRLEGLLAIARSGVKSSAVPAGELVLTAMRENTIVLTKFARRSAVDVVKIPNSGPRTPPVPGTVPDGEK